MRLRAKKTVLRPQRCRQASTALAAGLAQTPGSDVRGPRGRPAALLAAPPLGAPEAARSASQSAPPGALRRRAPRPQDAPASALKRRRGEQRERREQRLHCQAGHAPLRDLCLFFVEVCAVYPPAGTQLLVSTRLLVRVGWAPRVGMEGT
jgi:hypothetical protein